MLNFKKKEKKALEHIENYLDTAEACLIKARETIQAYLSGSKDELLVGWKEVDELEDKADRLLQKVRDLLFSGAYLPTVREDIHRLLETLDRVVNAAESCCDFFASQHPEIPEDQKEALNEILEDSFGIIKPLKRAVRQYFKRKGSIKDIRESTEQVKAIESVVDDKEWNLTTSLFASSNVDLSHKLHTKMALDHIAEISDRAEDACDELELVALKVVV